MDQNLSHTDPVSFSGKQPLQDKKDPADLSDDMVQSQQDLAQAAVSGQVPTDDNQIQPQASPAQPVSGSKEQKETGPLTPKLELEKVEIVEQKEPEPKKEVKDWVEKVESGDTAQLKKPVIDDYGQILVEAAEKKEKPKITLPLNEKGVEEGLHHKAIDSFRWLAEWCVRVMKMATGRVFYKPS